MILEGEKVNLRRIMESDYARIINWNKNELLTYYMGNRLPKTHSECHLRYKASNKLLNKILAIEDKQGDLIGEVELDHIQWRDRQGEIFIYIGDKSLWNKGYGTEALELFLNYLIREKEFKYIYLRVYENNKRAIKCYEKCGFKKRGVLRFNKNSTHKNLVLMELLP